MSKNSYRPGVNQYANQEEARRKARGNPNKNVHQKKKNSNYAGYAGNPVTQKIIEKANQQERVKLPTWLNIWLAVLFAAAQLALGKSGSERGEDAAVIVDAAAATAE